MLKIKLSYSKDPIRTENRTGNYFIPCCSSHLNYIGLTRRRLKARLKEYRRKIKNEEIDSSYIFSHSWLQNHYFKCTKACIVSSVLSTCHLNFHEAFYIIKNFYNLVNELPYMPSISDTWKLFAKYFLLFLFFLLSYSFIFNHFIFFYVLFIRLLLFFLDILILIKFLTRIFYELF